MNHLLLNDQFMIPKERAQIYRSETLFRFSFEQEFDINGFFHKENIDRIKIIQPDLDKIDSYPILMLDDPRPCQIHPEVLKSHSVDPDFPWTTYFAIPICVFFGNYFIWLYLTEEEYKTEFVFRKIDEVYNIPKKGELFKLVKNSIKQDIGMQYKADINIDSKYYLPIFDDPEEAWSHYCSKPVKYNNLNFKQEFTILEFAKPFYNPHDMDSLQTENRGGTYVQPIKILAIDPEKIGWIAISVSRARYCMEKLA